MNDLPNLANRDSADRVNRVVDHLRAHLDQPLSLERAAEVACFSPFHFHRIFKAIAGEPLHAFVMRVRLEQAVYLLSHRDRPSLTSVALACGFSSSSDFSRSFRRHFGVPPRAFDFEGYRRGQRDRMQSALTPADQPAPLAPLPPGANPDGFVARVRRVPPRRVAYVRVWRPYEGTRVATAAAEMVAWAQARGLADGQWLGYMWEDPDIVALERCRYDIGLEVPDAFQPEPGVGAIDLPAMTVAEVDIAGPIDAEQRAIDWMFRTWLPQSGYVPADQPCFEVWKGQPFAQGFTHFTLSIQLPVVSVTTPL